MADPGFPQDRKELDPVEALRNSDRYVRQPIITGKTRPVAGEPVRWDYNIALKILIQSGA
jgi:hypothetical protein